MDEGSKAATTDATTESISDGARLPSLPPFDVNSNLQEGIVVELSQGKTWYKVLGTSGSWIVLLHGISWWSFSYQDVAAFLESLGHRVLLFDFYGRGHSSSPAMSYTPDAMVQQVEDLLEALKIEGKISFVGNSMGGVVLSRYAAKNPDRVKDLVLIGPAVVPVAVPFVAKLMTTPVIGSGLFHLFGEGALLKRLKENQFKDEMYDPTKNPELIKELSARVEWLISHKQGFRDAFHSTLSHFPFAAGSLKDVEAVGKGGYPVLLIWGEHHIVCPFKDRNLIIERIPHIKFAPIKDAGHACLFEGLDQCLEAFASFYKEIEN